MVAGQVAGAKRRESDGDPRPLRVRVIRGLAVEGIDERALGSRKARIAMRTLALARGTPVSTDRLVEAVWDDDQPRDPAAQLAVIISRLRRVLGTDKITHGDLGYTLHCDWLDLIALDALVAEAERRLTSGGGAAALAAATAARSLLGLQGTSDPGWPADEASALERLAHRVLRLVARAALTAGDLGTGVEAAEQVLDADMFDEEALRLAMAGLAAAGQSSSALALHERVRRHIADELGSTPSAETNVAHRSVLKGLPVPGIPVGYRDSRGTHLRSPLVGRAEELQAIAGAFASVAGGGPAVVILEGEPGIGKTALANAWIAASEAPGTVLSTRCDMLTRGLPLQPVLQLIRGALRRAGAASAARLLSTDAPLLGPVLDVQSGAAEVDPERQLSLASSPAGIAMLSAALRRVVVRMCPAPSVLFIDDINHADPLTLAWLSDLARLETVPLLLLLTRRSGAGPELGAGRVLTLIALSEHEVASLVGAEKAPHLHRRSGGNPLYLTLLNTVGDVGAGRESVAGAVLARCAEAPEAAGTLRHAAVLGNSIDVELLADATRADPIQVLDHLDAGVGLAILEVRDGAYAFRHEIVRDALAAATSAPRRALLHRQAARALATRPDADPIAVAEHARLSGSTTIASEALTAASRIALERFDYATALSLASEAVLAEDTAEARRHRAIVLLRLARYTEAMADAEAASAAGGADAWEVAGSVAYYNRDFKRAAALGRALHDEAADVRQQAQGLVITARALHAGGEIDAANRTMEAAMRLCELKRIRRPAAVYGFLKVHMGDAGAAIQAIEAAPSAEALSTIYTPVHAELVHGYALATCGQAGQARAVLARATLAAEHRGLVRYASLGANFQAWTLRNIGEVARAQERNEEVSVAARTVGYRELEVYAALDPCDDDLAEGDIAMASQRLVLAESLMRQPYAYDWRHRLRLLLIQGRIALLSEHVDAAAASAQELIEQSEARLAPRYAFLGETLLLRARAGGLARPPAEAQLQRLADSLAAVAGMESWWLLAELGTALESPPCWSLAEQHRSRLAATLADGDAAGFQRYSEARLARIRSHSTAG